MNFIAQMIAFHEADEQVEGKVLNPKASRGSRIKFHLSCVRNQDQYARFLPKPTNLFVGAFDEEYQVIHVEFLARQQFQGVVRTWDPIHMQATIEYPALKELHSQQFNHPWLAEGDDIIVEGDDTAFDADLSNFELCRRMRTRQLETGIISRFCAGQGYVMTSQYETLVFEIQDVLLSDGRDFYRFDQQTANCYPCLEETFDVNEQVCFFREPSRGIRVFLKNTSFGDTDPLRAVTMEEFPNCLREQISTCTAKPLPPCSYQPGAEISRHCALKQSGFMYCGDSRKALSCPDVSTCWNT